MSGGGGRGYRCTRAGVESKPMRVIKAEGVHGRTNYTEPSLEIFKSVSYLFILRLQALSVLCICIVQTVEVAQFEVMQSILATVGMTCNDCVYEYTGW